MKITSSAFVLACSLCFHIKDLHAQTPSVEDSYQHDTIAGLKKSRDALTFLVLGDWGRSGIQQQKDVAKSMAKAAADLDIDFVVTTGDNFYPYGVASTGDYHWISSFESVYSAHSLYVKWHPVLGNHDYSANPDAEVAYTKVSARWDMPSRYYSKKFIRGGDTILIAFIDTDPIHHEMGGGVYDSIKFVKGAVQQQVLWLQTLLASSGARWKMVVGHHPMYTGGGRMNTADTKSLRAFLTPMFEKYKVDFYIAGHEHHLAHTKPKGYTNHIISGAGSEVTPGVVLYPDGGKFAKSTQGYAAFSVTHESVLVQFIDHKDKIVHTSVIKK